MANRQEFTRDVRAEIARRAQVPTGFRCEGCGAIVLRFEIHHVKQDAMKTEDEKRKRLTAKDGLLLCIPCHAVESGKQAPVMAKVKRQEARHLGVQRKPARPIKSRGFASSKKQPRIAKAHLPPREIYR